MNILETAKLLAAINARDGRDVSRLVLEVWQHDLADIPFADAMAALDEFYASREEGDRFMVRAIDLTRRARGRAQIRAWHAANAALEAAGITTVTMDKAERHRALQLRDRAYLEALTNPSVQREIERDPHA